MDTKQHNSIENAMLPFKVKELLEIIMQKKHLSMEDALLYLYNTDTYMQLQQEEAKLWYDSGFNLYERIEQEKAMVREQENQDSKILLFISFCIEAYKRAVNIGGLEVLALFHQYAVFSFLSINYEILHTQGERYIVEEIVIFLKNKRK